MIANEKTKHIHELIAHGSTAFPDRIALVDKGVSLTYQQLDKQSDEFCLLLTTANVGRGDFIALCVEHKSAALLTCILGILKSGAAYVPISPSLPKSLQENILSAINPRFLISDKLTNETMQFNGFSILPIASPQGEPDAKLANANLAYVIYTSGTTGEPKGVGISHGNLLSTYHSWASIYDLAQQDRHLQMADASFDVFTGDWVRALCSGGTLVLCQKELLVQPHLLFELIHREKITIAEFVPAVLRNLMDFVDQHNKRLSTFRLLICGSDLWTIGEYKRVKALCSPHARVINSYGLTETTIDSTYFELTDSDCFQDADIVPIGKPFPHVSIMIMNESQRSTPEGEVGEIYIGGAGVSAVGYLHQDTLTQDRFLSLPYIQSDTLFYRTGDQAKLHSDGSLLFLGRNEFQANAEGKRVDILSIESLLPQYPGISQGLVIPQQKDGKTQLCAFVVADSSVFRDPLVAFLKARLPLYCVPHTYHLLDTIPLTSQFKVDRKLSSLKVKRPLPSTFEPGNTPLEFAISDIWRDCLSDLENFSVTHSFAELGGSSLDFVRVLSQINERYGVSIKPAIESLTVRKIANVILQEQASKAKEVKMLKERIVVVGGGPAGISFCRQLVQKLIEEKKRNVEIIVFEKSDSIGLGLPYAYKEDHYILNLPIEMMALGGDTQGQFARWFNQHSSSTYNTAFPPRHVFGQYIQHVASELKVISKEHGIHLRYIKNTEILAVKPLQDKTYAMIAQDVNYIADHVVFCIGHMPSNHYKEFIHTPGYRHNPWAMDAYAHIEKTQAVAVIGSRVSAIDVVMKLKSIEHSGKIKLFSRNGLLPTVLSKSIPPYPLEYLTLDYLFNQKSKNGYLPLNSLMAAFWKEVSKAEGRPFNFSSIVTSYKQCSALDWLRHEIEKSEAGPKPWQQVLFSFYPLIPAIWSNLSLADQQLFLEKYHSLFLTYLAAFPLENAYKLLPWLESGEVEIQGGLQSVTWGNDKFCLSTDKTNFHAPHLFNATGPGTQASDYSLFRNMEARGISKPHPCGGLCVDTDNLRLKNKSGLPLRGLYAIGELTRGSFWATTDMSQVNTQCSKVISHLIKVIKRPYSHKIKKSLHASGIFGRRSISTREEISPFYPVSIKPVRSIHLFHKPVMLSFKNHTSLRSLASFITPVLKRG